MNVYRNEIWFADLSKHFKEDVNTHRQKGKRPCVIVSSEENNENSLTVQVIPCSKQVHKMLPIHVLLGKESGLKDSSIALTEQMTTIDKSDLIFKIGDLHQDKIKSLNRAMQIQSGLIPPFDISKANKYLNKLSRINKLIKKLEGYNMPTADEIIEKNSVINEFKDYCCDYDINYAIVINKYNERNRIQRDEMELKKVSNE